MNEHLGKPSDVAGLQLMVQQYRVCYEILPTYRIDGNDGRHQIGHEIYLYGTHAHPENHRGPGCNECVDVMTALNRLAKAVVPAERRGVRVDIRPFSGWIGYTSRRHWRPDVRLMIALVNEPTEAVDACLTVIRDRLDRLGVPQGEWRTDFEQGETAALPGVGS